MNKIWFTSDLHFMHKNIVKFTNRGVETNEQDHDQWLEDMWNSTVAKGDMVYHLGDLSFNKKSQETVKLLDRLNGNKVLIKGNHDHSDAFETYAIARGVSWTGHYKEIKIEGQSVVLFHFPIGSWHKQGHGSWHLHGHSHGNYQDSRGKMLDVGIDNAYNLFGKHKFFEWKDIQEYMNQQETYVSDSHRENI